MKISFAPIQGYTDHIYRRIHSDFFKGVDHYYTPFLRLPQRNKDIKDVNPTNNNMELVTPQIIGGKSEEMQFLLEYVESLGYTRVDLNFGCPFRVIVKKGKGCGTLNKPETFAELLKEVPNMSSLKLSLKIRLGWDNIEQLMQHVDLINQLPFTSVAVHARYGQQEYKGECDLDAFEQFYSKCTHPIVYNGDIQTPKDAEEIMQRFPKLEGIMIGRGLLADPALAQKIKGIESEEMDYRGFHDALLAEYSTSYEGGDHQILDKMKTIWDYFRPETDRKILKQIKKCRKLNDYKGIIGSMDF